MNLNAPRQHFLIFLLLACTLANGSLYVFTEDGRLCRSTNDGTSWSWIMAPMPSSDCVDMGSDPYHYIYVLTKSGEVHRSLDCGATWISRGNVPVSDASAIWVITGLTFVVTESGDFYQRENSTGTWSLLGNVGASDCVDITPHPAGGYLVLTHSGDVWSVNTAPFTKSLLGNIGSSSVIGGATLAGAVLAATEQGDIARSTNGGTAWSWVGTISQVGSSGIANKGSYIYMTTNAGEVTRSTDQGTSWLWRGNVSQMGIKGMVSDSVSVIGVEENLGVQALQILSVFPNPSRGHYRLRFWARLLGAASVRLFDVLGREVNALWRGKIEAGENNIEIEQKTTGIYFLVIESDRARANQKIVTR